MTTDKEDYNDKDLKICRQTLRMIKERCMEISQDTGGNFDRIVDEKNNARDYVRWLAKNINE